MSATRKMFEKAYGRYLATRQAISIECEVIGLEKKEVKTSSSPGTCTACQCTEIPRLFEK